MRKNNRYGLMDNNGKFILHTSFKSITYKNKEHLNLDLFIVTSETGVFLFNYTNRTESKEYDEILWYSDEYFSFKNNGKYGIIDNNGIVLVNAVYTINSFHKNYNNFLTTKLLGYNFYIYFENQKLYGVVPIDKYDKCVKLGGFLEGFYITYKNGKYGLLDNYGKTVVKPYLNKIILYDGIKKPYIEIKFSDGKSGKYVNIIFVITKKNNKFALYDVISGKCIISNCDEMDYVIGPKRIQPKQFDFIYFKKNGSIGYVTEGGYIIDKYHFDNFHLDHSFWIVSKNGKWGVLNLTGFERFPCIYDDIKHIHSGKFLAHENGVEKTIGESYYYKEHHNYSRQEMMRDTWDALTDGQYGDMPDYFDGDCEFLGY